MATGLETPTASVSCTSALLSLCLPGLRVPPTPPTGPVVAGGMGKQYPLSGRQTLALSECHRGRGALCSAAR